MISQSVYQILNNCLPYLFILFFGVGGGGITLEQWMKNLIQLCYHYNCLPYLFILFLGLGGGGINSGAMDEKFDSAVLPLQTTAYMLLILNTCPFWDINWSHKNKFHHGGWMLHTTCLVVSDIQDDPKKQRIQGIPWENMHDYIPFSHCKKIQSGKCATSENWKN